MGKQTIIIILLGVLLLGAIGYIGYAQYNKWQQNKQITAYATFQQGAQYGYEQAVTQLYQQAVTCQAVPVKIGEQSINMIAVECLQQQQQQQQPSPEGSQ
ncbi:MAG: hypothetical protein Q8Q31_00025 [Nanoarchaeota archaeon]|nr:hypothetical protein [Nanoarchaeota archaeon]